MSFSFLLLLNGQKIFHANDNYPANIRLDEDVLKTSFVFVFKRRLDEDEYILINHSLQKTSWPRPIYSSCPYVYKIYTSSRSLANTSWRHLQDVLLKSLWEVFNMFVRRTAKTVVYRRIHLCHTSEKFTVSVQKWEWYKFLKF